jgi:molybdate transport system ATP-binding protein
MRKPLISLTDIRCNLGRGHRFEGLSWQLGRGEQWAIVGPNGAGKTALSNLLGSRLAIASGQRHYAPGFDPARDIAYVSFELQKQLCDRDQRLDISEFSAAAFDPGTTARQAILQGRPAPDDMQQQCRRYRLEALLETGIRYLSSGEMRKVLLLRGLLPQPQLLILDDPLEGLDRVARPELARMLEDAMDAGQQVLLLTRHKRNLPRAISHILLLDNLRKVASGPRTGIMATRQWADLFPPLPALPDTLPPPAAGHAVYQPDPALDPIAGHQLTATYQGKTVLQGVDLVLRRGEHLAIRGPNGCGKTTLLNLICGENHKAYGQQLRLYGRLRGSGETLWQVKALFGVVSNQFQAGYVRGWNAMQVVVSGFYHSVGLYRDAGASERRAALAWLQALHLDDRATQAFSTLSYGQQRLVLVARAMVTHPPILVLDEPCTGLDDYNRVCVLRLLDFIAANSSTQILYVSHLAAEIPSCVNRVLEFRPHHDGLYRLVAIQSSESGFGATRVSGSAD